MTAQLSEVSPPQVTPAPSPAEVKEKRQWRKAFAFDGWGALALPLLVFLGLLFVVPIVALIAKSFTDPTVGFENYRAIFADSVYVRVLINTFVVALTVTVVTLALGYPYAYVMTLVSPKWRALMMVVILIPFWTSILVRSFALIVLLRDTGVLNTIAMNAGILDEPMPILRTLPGVIFGMVQIALPFMVLPIYASMRSIDPRLSLAAQALGDRPSGAFWRVFVPLSASGVAAGTLLTFVQALGYYITPALLGGPKNMMIGELIVQQVSTVLRFGFASALAVLLLVTTFALLAIASRIVDVERILMGRS
ncbi:ABC transporter permease [Gordonia desulfuricans]|uniref:ABC transporter permease n=1 Tax=Gordonia desulfuricans TaxID=89051 RepID=A0A7K3LRG2_9ACTN|nr:ABC transporter permease [Gordonia desulfuricans]NDK90137.1 ABC transporter permease [Gordonia desulfuricans]